MSIDNLALDAHRRETEDRVKKNVDFLNRGEQLVMLQRLYMLCDMQGKMADIGHEINLQFLREHAERNRQKQGAGS